MLKSFLLELKKNFLSITFLLSAIILAAEYITQCEPGEFQYLSEPKTREQFICETLLADAERKATEEITGFILKNGGYEKETIYEKIPLTDDALNFMERMLEQLKQGQQIFGYDNLNEELHLQKERKKWVRALSGGMKRRLGIAVSIIHAPKILLVDEPTAGLDPEERLNFRNMFVRLAKDKTILLSTHIISDIADTCEKLEDAYIYLINKNN